MSATSAYRGCTPHFEGEGRVVRETQVKMHRMIDEEFEVRGGDDNDSSGDSSDLFSVDLFPGSVLYFPPGTWHRVETVGDSASLSINFSLVPLTYHQLLTRSLSHFMMSCASEPRFRQPVTFGGGQQHPHQVIRQLAGKVKWFIDKCVEHHPQCVVPDSFGGEGDDGDDGDDGDGDQDDVVIIEQFTVPPSSPSASTPITTSTSFFFNPLSVLLAEEDVCATSSTPTSSSSSSSFILHTNFGGESSAASSSSFASMQRVVLRCEREGTGKVVEGVRRVRRERRRKKENGNEMMDDIIEFGIGDVKEMVMMVNRNESESENESEITSTTTFIIPILKVLLYFGWLVVSVT